MIRLSTKAALASWATYASRLLPKGALHLSVAACICAPSFGMSQSLPTGETNVSGTATVARPDEARMVVTQSTPAAILEWDSFSVGEGFLVKFNQPDASAVILNRVRGGESQSYVDGTISANGSVHLVNPNGIFIGLSGVVNAQGFVASTLDITDADFNAGNYTYTNDLEYLSENPVSNDGAIEIFSGGYAALLGGNVDNAGTVTVPIGRIGFGSGQKMTLDMSGDQFLQVAMPSEGLGPVALITNSGTASAEGGLIEMRAATAREAVRQAINLTGVAEASSVSVRGGSIVLDGGAGGQVAVIRSAETGTGRLNTTSNVAQGGSLTITGYGVTITDGVLDASGATGGGNIVIGVDPSEINGFDARVSNPLEIAHTVILTGNDFGGPEIMANATTNGDGGNVILWSSFDTTSAGFVEVNAAGATGAGGSVAIIGTTKLTFGSEVYAASPSELHGSLFLRTNRHNITNSPLTVALNTTNVDIVALDTVGGSPSQGEIELIGDLFWASNTTLTLNSEGAAPVLDGITAGQGNLVIDANADFEYGSTMTLASVAIDAGASDVDLTFTSAITATDVNINAKDITLSGTLAVDDLTLAGAKINSNGETTASQLNITATELRHSGQLTQTGAGGFVDVDTFSIVSPENYSVWRQSDASSQAFSADNFNARVTGADFLRTAGGQGTAADPYVIIDIFGLQGIQAGEAGDTFVLGNDIDAKETAGWNDGFGSNGFASINAFASNLDGAQHTVANLFLGTSQDSIFRDRRAMFYYIEKGASIFDLNITNATHIAADGAILARENYGTITNVRVSGTVTADGSSLFNYTGGLVGYNGGTINDSVADVAVTFDDTGSESSGESPRYGYVGGFVGVNEGTINRSHATGIVTATNVANEEIFVGGFAGLVGDSSTQTINNSYATGDVTVSNTLNAATVGGFVGVINGAINQSFSTGAVDVSGAGTHFVGGFAGAAGPSASGESSVWNITKSGQPVSAAGTDVTESQFLEADAFMAVATPLGWDFRTVWAPAGPGGFLLNYTTSPIVFVIPDTLTVLEGETGSAIATGTVTGGTGSFINALDSDTINVADILSNLTFSSTKPGVHTYTVTGTVTSSRGQVYQVSSAQGTVIINPAPLPPLIIPSLDLPNPPIIPSLDLPNPPDSVFALAPSVPAEVFALAPSVPAEVLQISKQTLGTTRSIAQSFRVSSCDVGSTDVTRYLGCLSQSLDEFGSGLNELATQLPPGLENVGQIIQNARVDIDRVRVRAQRRLSTATTDAERDTIRRDAVNESSAALSTASNEIRKAISLVRADDPELASVQRETIVTVAAAVDTVRIQLIRAVSL
jgi:filamentous hemagglutinin family protein